jgi:hypothetical protein
MRFILPLLAAPFLLTACATQPDPAVVCSAEWIAPRTERAMNDIERRSSSALKSLRRVGESYAQGKKPGLLQLLSLSNSIKSLEKQVKNGRGIRDLKTLARTCDDPKILTESLTGFMRDQGLPDNMINFVTQLPAYQSILEDTFGPKSGAGENSSNS